MSDEHPPSIVVLSQQARFDQLITVLPIAQRHKRDGVEMLALALEIYRTGFAVTLQAQSHGAVPFVDIAPTVTLDLTDDCGRRYVSQPYGASGEGV